MDAPDRQLDLATPQVRVGIDIGGTFTDAVLVDADSGIHVAKTPSTASAPATGFAHALTEVGAASPAGAADANYLVHGTTVATNAAVEKRLARVGLLTTHGFGDTLEIGTQQRADLYDLSRPREEPLVPTERRVEVRERVGPAGEVLTPLSRDEIEPAARRLREMELEAVAVCFLFSFVNPRHEQIAAEILGELLPGIPLSLSSDVAPEFREYLRMSTTVLNAALQPIVGDYVGALGSKLADAEVSAPLHLMQSNGGITTAEVASKVPIGLLASGPAAGAIGGGKIAEAAGESNALTFDMGGTTADVALVVGGTPQLRFRGEAAGHPVNLPQVDVLSVGAGGGSIASVDQWGALSVGPRSAGSDPGPAAYGRGGQEPTVTDAHLILGTLAADRFLGGRMPLDLEAARRAMAKVVAEPLGLSLEAAAAAVISLANAEMVSALHVITVERGQDPRRFALVALGGAGALHACSVAEELGIGTIIVPRYPGLASALGLLLSDVRHDLRRSWRGSMNGDASELAQTLQRLGADADDHLGAAGVAPARRILEYELDMRYRGQAFELTIPAGDPAKLEAEELVSAFHDAHERIYGHASRGRATEVVTVRARGIGSTPVIAWRKTEGSGHGEAPGSRLVWTNGGPVPHTVVQRVDLAAESRLRGPAIIEQDDSTVWIREGWRLDRASAGTIVMRSEAGRDE